MAFQADELPDEAGLRAGAAQLRTAADSLGSRASTTNGVAEVIGPGVWVDSASTRAKALLGELADELSTGSSSLHQAADALDSLAQYVSSQRGRYDEIGTQMAALEHQALNDPTGGDVVEAASLLEERRAIESNTTAAMAQARDVINQAAARATRYHGSSGHSVWSRISDFVSGLWDGTYDMGKGLLSLAVTAAKLSPARLLVDPSGYFHDSEHVAQEDMAIVSGLVHDPGKFLKALVNYGEMKSDPVHWAGEILPSILIAAVSGGAGAMAKGADGVEALDAAAAADGSAGFSSTLPPDAVDHFTDGLFNKNDIPVGFHSAPDGVPPVGRRIDEVEAVNNNGTYQAKVSFQAEDGSWVNKPVAVHTMFPNSWTREDAIRAVEQAFDDKEIISGNLWEGTYNGVIIQGYVAPDGSLITAFPAAGQ